MPEQKEFQFILPTDNIREYRSSTYSESACLKSQIQIWKEDSLIRGILHEVTMNERKEVAAAPITAAVFYTAAFYGCVFYLTLESERFKFGHIDAIQAKHNLTQLTNLDPKKTIIVIPDIPELASVSGLHVFKYHLDLNPDLDSFAELMALQESPELLSICVSLKKMDNHFEGYLNAFQMTPNARWDVPYYPKQIAAKVYFPLS